MQAILTKYHGPTNTRGSRISAAASAGKIFVEYDHALDLEGNHRAAAGALAVKLKWSDGFEIVTGCLPGGEYCHTLSRAVYEARALLKRRLNGDDVTGNPYSTRKWGKLVDALACDLGVSPDASF